MSRTLFLYIFKDLLRVFLLASGALAGIMSFGALLRPLTEHGLDGSQVARMLGFLMPAMTTYSLPIAALFATTMVYGRLSADNELTAVRAAGISHLAVAAPAIVMGLLVALASLLFLCFVVPTFTYKVEKVIYSNLARLVANEIERTHQIRFGDVTVYAEGAILPEPDPSQPNTQSVVLVGPMIVNYDDPPTPDAPAVPNTFFTAREAHVMLNQDPQTDQTSVEGLLVGGSALGRGRALAEGGVNTQSFGPWPIESSIQEETKFMNIGRLRELLADPGKSRRLRGTVDDFVRNDQRSKYLRSIRQQLNTAPRSVNFDGGADRYVLSLSESATTKFSDRHLVITAGTRQADEVALTRIDRNGATMTADARQVRIAANVRSASDQIVLDVALIDVVVRIGDERSERDNFAQQIVVEMPPDIRKLKDRTPTDYLQQAEFPEEARARLWRDWFKVTNGIQSELHGRASFAVSCLILVVVGSALGMMFRSGNFLSAFAVSVVPALLCISLIATGQQTCENIPSRVVGFDAVGALHMGLALIWSGNVLVLLVAVVLMWRLQRQ